MSDRLEIRDLCCTRGDRPLFSGLSRTVQSGELLHVVGSNGSGKTTLLRTLCGLSRPAEGEIRWKGRSVSDLADEYRADLVYVGHLDGVQGELTLTENLRAQACLEGQVELGAIAGALECVELSARGHLPAKILSQGQHRRLALARLLLLKRPIWILDEPFTALDTKSCRIITRLLEEQLERGGLVILSSHQDFELAGRASRIDLDRVRAASKQHRTKPASRSILTDHHAT